MKFKRRKFQSHFVGDFEYQCDDIDDKRFNSFIFRTHRQFKVKPFPLCELERWKLKRNARSCTWKANVWECNQCEIWQIRATWCTLTRSMGLVLSHFSNLCEFSRQFGIFELLKAPNNAIIFFFCAGQLLKFEKSWKVWRKRRARIMTTKCHMSPMPDKRQANAFNGGNLCESICDCVNRFLNVKSHISHGARASMLFAENKVDDSRTFPYTHFTSDWFMRSSADYCIRVELCALFVLWSLRGSTSKALILTNPSFTHNLAP